VPPTNILVNWLLGEYVCYLVFSSSTPYHKNKNISPIKFNDFIELINDTHEMRRGNHIYNKNEYYYYTIFLFILEILINNTIKVYYFNIIS
jgi:hypothetical protein